VTNKREKVHKVDRKGVEAHQNPMASSGSSGGVAISGLGQPGGDRLGFWGGAGTDREGVYMGWCCVAEGLWSDRIGEESGISCSGAPCSSRFHWMG
jgi:hypothetical protein